MSVSTPRRLLSRLLSCLLKFLAIIRRLPPFGLVNRLFAFLPCLPRWTHRRPTLHERPGSLTPTATLDYDYGVACATNVPSPGAYDADEHRRPSPVDSTYTNTRSPSGHLISCSPAPVVRCSLDNIPWETDSQTSFHDEPDSINRDGSQPVSDTIPQSSHSNTHPIHHGSHMPKSGILTHPSHPPGPLHPAISFGLETLLENPSARSSPGPAVILFDTDRLEPHRSRTPLSPRSSISISRTFPRSYNPRDRTGRATYRGDYCSSTRTSARRVAPALGPPYPLTTRRAEPSGSVVFENYINPPSADDPNRPGSPNYVGTRFYPMSVHNALRYENRDIRCPSEDDYQIEAMMYQYPETPFVSRATPEGWTGYRHPEGTLYFMHRESKTFTEVDIYDDQIYKDIEYFRKFLFSELITEIQERNLSESLKVDEVQLVLEPRVDEIGIICCYYFVNPRTRSLFWLDGWEAFEIFKDCRGILSSSHKGLAIQTEYWSHWDLYPNFCKVTQELKDEVMDMILYATFDHLTSDTSPCPRNPEELNNYLSLIDRIEPERTERCRHSTIIIGRIMHMFYHNYFLDFYGESCARLDFDQSIYGWRYHPSTLMTISAPLLFMAPVNNVRLLHKIFVDDIASKEKWNMFVNKLNSQLQETSVLATVLLNANVGFLPEVSGTGTSFQQILSYMSIVASMASIILGLIFMGHIRTKARNTPLEAAKFLRGLRHKRRGLEALAIAYSLPYAFLMWAMVLFFAAFLVQWWSPGDMVSRGYVGAFMLIVAFLALWCIWIARDRYDFWWFQPDPSQVEHEGPEEAEGDNTVSTGILGLGFLRKFTSLISKFIMSTPPLPCESHGMQDTTSRHDVPGPPSNLIPQPTLMRPSSSATVTEPHTSEG